MRTLLSLFLLLLGCSCGGPVLHAEVPRGYALVDGSVVALVEEDGHLFCSGVVIPEGVLTAAHCVRDEEAVLVARHDWLGSWDTFNHSVSLRVLAVDFTDDLALLARPRAWEASVRVAVGNPYPGQPVVSCGHPMGLAYVCNAGRVSGGERSRTDRSGFFLVDVGLIPGMSGGPVWDEDGNVLGINSFYVGTPALGGAISPRVIRDFLARL